MIRKIIVALLMSSATAAMAVPLGSQSVLVVEEGTGKILLEKNANSVVPIASLTKLMTAMVVLDARQNMDELIAIDKSDVDTFKFSTSRVPVGGVISRRDMLQLALMSSDNRAAHSLARTFPGGEAGFRAAVNNKIRALGMVNTRIEEPTGLSPNNRSSATDLVKMAKAAAAYPEIARMSTDAHDNIRIGKREVRFNNTNRLVGAKGWDVGLSKTGYTEEAGRCLIMNIKAAGKNATLVLLNAKASSVRIMDALSIRRLVSGGVDEPVVRTTKYRSAYKVAKVKAPFRVNAKFKMSAKPTLKKVSYKPRKAAVRPKRRS
jgi:D-alanyl-D-alanine carboxypeptidase/D-alanyl-D-alanine endopeptidase (penicillin-binding protein 7)